MITKILEQIAGIGTYPVIAMLLFIAVFIGFAAWALMLSRSEVEQASRIPLDSDDSTSKGDERREA